MPSTIADSTLVTTTLTTAEYAEIAKWRAQLEAERIAAEAITIRPRQFTRAGLVKHDDACVKAWGRLDPDCARCDELAQGATVRRW